MKFKYIKNNIPLLASIILLCISCQSEDERYLCNIVNQISACSYRSNTQGYSNYNTQSAYNTQSYNTQSYNNPQSPDMYTCIETAQNTLLQQINMVDISYDKQNRVTRAINTFSTCRNNPANTGNTGVNPNMYTTPTYTTPGVNPNYNYNQNMNTNANNPMNQLKRCTNTFTLQLRNALSC